MRPKLACIMGHMTQTQIQLAHHSFAARHRAAVHHAGRSKLRRAMTDPPVLRRGVRLHSGVVLYLRFSITNFHSPHNAQSANFQYTGTQKADVAFKFTFSCAFILFSCVSYARTRSDRPSPRGQTTKEKKLPCITRRFHMRGGSFLSPQNLLSARGPFWPAASRRGTPAQCGTPTCGTPARRGTPTRSFGVAARGTPAAHGALAAQVRRCAFLAPVELQLRGPFWHGRVAEI